MNLFKWLNYQINKFSNSIDTITTKLLTLVLCCMAIPLIVVATFSSDIINQSIVDNANIQLEINKKIFDRKYLDERRALGKNVKNNTLEFMKTNKLDTNEQSKKFIHYLFKNNDALSFAMVLDSKKDIKAFNGNVNPDELLNDFSKLIKISFAENYLLSTELFKNDLYHLIIHPLFEDKNVSSIVIVGKSLKNGDVTSYVNNITNATVAIYSKNNDAANIVATSDKSFDLNNFVEVNNSNLSKQKYLFNGDNLLNPNDFHINFTLTNFFNKPIGKVYLGTSKFSYIAWVSKNNKLISIISIISLVVAIIIAALFARKITDPILALKEAAESTNLGDLNYKVDIKGNDETVKLSKAFNKMVNNLKRDERLRNNFVATLTHDLKVPMLAENQTVSFLLKETYGPLTADQKEVLELIKSTNSSSLEMIGTLLEVYRYDCGNAQLFLSEFDVVELAKDSINQIKSLAEDKKIQLNVDSSHEKVMVKADKRDIKRLMHNLVSNAISHGINRGHLNFNIEVINDTVTYEPKSDIDYYTSLKEPVIISNSILVSVEDNGVGINREDMPLLFNRFSLSKGRKPAGSGLGLYYANQVITLHKGKIWAESSETGGSRFKFTLPFNSTL